MEVLKNNIDINTYAQLDPKEIKIRKKLKIYQKENTLLLQISQKSRILQKDVEIYENIVKKIEEYLNKSIQVKQIAIDAPLCSKAKVKFEIFGWHLIIEKKG